MGIPFWTDEQTDAILRLWAEGHSTSQIGNLVGRTRNSIIGRLHRLKAPEPAAKQKSLRNLVYTRQTPESIRLKAEVRRLKYREAHKSRRLGETAAQFRANGTSLYSAAFRKHLPRVQMTKAELRAMLTLAVQNTAAL